MRLEAHRERAAIVEFLRKRTHLVSLAQLIEDGAHWFSDATLDAWAAKQGFLVRPGGPTKE